MKTLFFDSIGGASGDMILAALIDLGVDVNQLNKDLSSLGIGPFRITPRPHSESGLHGLRLDISLPESEPTSSSPPASVPHHDHNHNHDHTHGHGHEKGHSHAHDRSGEHPPLPHPTGGHGGRGLREITRLIENSSLPQAVQEASIDVFHRLAVAEARVHRCDPEKIHFHEVGALDSILDVVGCCLARYRLDIKEVAVSPLPLGRGSFQCEHGVLPIPSPATVELLRDIPVVRTDEPYELVTPTGAAIMASWRTTEHTPGTVRMAATGHGFGSRSLNGRPNLLRAILATDNEAESCSRLESCLELACNLDDMTPELIGSLIPRLLAAGALDAFTTPVQMKKMRPGCLLTVLCRPCDHARFLDLLFAETTTFGIRWRRLERETLSRRHRQVSTPYGTVRVKIASRHGRDSIHAPEYEDCRQRAQEHKVPIREVYIAAQLAAADRA